MHIGVAYALMPEHTLADESVGVTHSLEEPIDAASHLQTDRLCD